MLAIPELTKEMKTTIKKELTDETLTKMEEVLVEHLEQRIVAELPHDSLNFNESLIARLKSYFDRVYHKMKIDVNLRWAAKVTIFLLSKL